MVVFYSESKDGIFTSDKGNKVYAIDGKLKLMYQTEYTETEEILHAVDVPDDLSQYFVGLLEGMKEYPSAK